MTDTLERGLAHFGKYYGVEVDTQENGSQALTDSDVDEIQNILDESSDGDEYFMCSPSAQFPKPKNTTN